MDYTVIKRPKKNYSGTHPHTHIYICKINKYYKAYIYTYINVVNPKSKKNIEVIKSLEYNTISRV